MISPDENEHLLVLADRVSAEAITLGRAKEDGDMVDVGLADEAHDEAWLELRDALDELTDRSP